MSIPSNIRESFPIFEEHPSLVYLDSAATSLKPREVIEKEVSYYRKFSANIHRGLYDISVQATEEFEEARKVVAEFIGAKNLNEVIFTSGTTESLNIVAHSYGDILKSGDEVVTTIAEHHSNFVPWQEIAKQSGAVLKIVDIDKEGHLLFSDYATDETREEDGVTLGSVESLITPNTKVFALGMTSNVLGTVHPVKEIIAHARQKNPDIVVVLDAAQAAGHTVLDVTKNDADFVAFSAHKMLGPTGVGVLWGKEEKLNQLKPLSFGGEMIDSVGITATTYKKAPHRFEAGTPNIAGVIALKAALWMLKDIGMPAIEKHERKLLEYAKQQLTKAFGSDITILGPKNTKERSSVIAFTLADIHPHDIAQVLDEHHVAIRAGHHCAEPLHKKLNIPASARMSFSVYNTQHDIDLAIDALKDVHKKLKRS